MDSVLAGNLVPITARMNRSSVSEESVEGSTVTVKVVAPDGTITELDEADIDVDDANPAYLDVTASWEIADDAARGIYVVEFDSNDPLIAAERGSIFVRARQTVSSGS